MFVSIIIPNYNGEKYIYKCLNSIYNQTFRNYEIIFVDNSSEDNSLKIVEKYNGVKVIKLNKNYGFSYAVNEGIKNAQGNYVVLLNNDTEAKPIWLEKLVNSIEEDTNIFSCCSKMIRYYEKEKIDDAGDEYTLLGWAYKCGDGANIRKYSKERKIFSSCAGAAIYRKEILDKIGYFDTSFFAYMEDVDISYRANVYGYKNIYCSDAEIYHIGSATSGSRHNAFKVKLAARNNVYVIIKNMPNFQILINSFFIALGFFVKYIFFLKKGLGKEFLEGTKEGLQNRKNIKRINYKDVNFFNYLKIECKLMINIFKLVGYKIYDKL